MAVIGWPYGLEAVFAGTGHFAKQRNPRGQQMRCVLAMPYGAAMVGRLCLDPTQLATALPQLAILMR